MTKDAGAGDSLAICHRRREPWARIDAQSRAPSSRHHDEAVGRSRVDEHNKGGGAQDHLELYCVADGHLGDRVQGEDRGFRVWGIHCRGVICSGDLDAVDVGDPLAYMVVPPCVLLVAVEAEALPTALLLLRQGQMLHLPAVHHDRGRSRLVDLGSRPRDATLAGVGVYYSRSSSWHTRLMAAARDCGLWTRTSRLSGGRRPPVNSWTRCASSRGPARGRSAWKRS
jgi:hypothetical protein